MNTIAQLRAKTFLQLADSYLAAGSPRYASYCAALAGRADASLWPGAAALLKAAAERESPGPEPSSDDLSRLHWHLQRLEDSTAREEEIRVCLPQSPPRETGADAQQPLPVDVRDDMARLERLIKGRSGPAFERAQRTFRDLLEPCGVDPPADEPQDSSPSAARSFQHLFDEFLSLEHELHNLGNDLYKLGRFENAITCYDVAIEIRPDLLETYFNRGLAYTRLSSYDKGEADLTRVIELNENLGEAFYTRGLIREYKLQYEAAIADYDQALRVDPHYTKAEDQRKIARQKQDSIKSESKRRSSDDDYEGVVKDFAIYRVKPDCRLSQVGDHAPVKREFRKILTYLRGGQLIGEWGGELPRGVLLHGEPGVGKTHLARALAGEAECPFYAPPISAVLDMYVGNSEKNLRNLFRVAAEHDHAIIFLDEIEVLASHRKESRQNHEPWQSRLSACLLEEMDNLPQRNSRVVVIAATNDLEAVDPAFLRPGRFTYIIEAKRPGDVGLAEILLICLEVAARRARRADFLDPVLQRAVFAPRQQWLETELRHDETGLARAARLAASKELVGDDVREVIRRIIDERIIAGLDGLDLGPITADDLFRHVQEYTPSRG